jgi:hypothetical protein
MERTREKRGKGKRSLIERLMGGAPKQDGRENDRVLPDVDVKSR